MTIPTNVSAKLEELTALCEKYPLKIPLLECAKFMGIDKDSLRACLERGSCPFGIGWIQKNANNRAFFIPTTTFWLWYTQGVGFKEEPRL